MTTETTYKGVKLTEGRTTKMIDTIIEKYHTMNNNELAELLGLPSFRQVNAMARALNIAPEKAPKKPVKRIREAKTTFTNYDGSGKAKARRLIAESIMQTKRQGSNILTLPAENWKMEKNILKQKSGYKFTAVEREKGTFLKMVSKFLSDKLLTESVIGLENKTIGEHIMNDAENTYSSAILDYCGFIDSFYDEINDVMKRNLVKKGGYITLTLAENDRLLNHSHHMNNYSNKFIKNCYAGKKPTGAEVTNDLVNFLVNSNTGYEIVTKFAYKDSTTKMLLFIIKRVEE